VRPTYHLVPAAVWKAQEPGRAYEAASLATEGFVHCTDGAAELVATANRHYRDDARDFLVLTIDLDAAGSPWRIEDERGIYPHVFGPIELTAILRSVPAPRDAAGLFLPFDDEDGRAQSDVLVSR
jgi:uncharacterized protein (DUF952 family)